MVQGSWVGVPLPVSFLFSLLFSVLPFIPYEDINCSGCGKRFHPMSLDAFLLLPSFHLFFFGVGARRPRSGGISFLPNLLFKYVSHSVYVCVCVCVCVTVYGIV